MGVAIASSARDSSLNGVGSGLWSWLAWLSLVPLILAGLWIVIPHLYGLSHVPARPKMIRRAMQLAQVQPGEILYDLGAGDGRAVVIAAREFGARAIGIEIEPVHCAVARAWALLNGVHRRVSIRRGNLLKADFRDADVVFLYLTPAFVERVRPHLERQLQPGARIVSLFFEFEGWQPSDIDIGHLIFLYQMPPQPGSIEDCLRASISRAGQNGHPRAQ
jgi:SAM-dependent methyltransferase